jgi:hypothetical protein
VLGEARELRLSGEWYIDWPKPLVSEGRSQRNGSFRIFEIEPEIRLGNIADNEK